MDVCLVIKERLEELGLEQRDLAAAAEVTESYISQLLTRKKLPPAPDRTDIYEKMGKFLKLSSGNLSKLAELQRREELKKAFEDPPAPLFAEVRALILRKCAPEKQQQIRAIFEKQPLANSNASLHRSYWTCANESPERNCKVRTGSTWSLDTTAGAISKCESSSSSFWTRMSSTYRPKIRSEERRVGKECRL